MQVPALIPRQIKTVRTSKTLQTQVLRRILEKKMEREFGAILDAQIENAKGIELLKLDKKGEQVTIKEKPDVNAAKMLFEYTLGKPTETIKHEGAVGLVHLIASLENGDSDSNEE